MQPSGDSHPDPCPIDSIDEAVPNDWDGVDRRQADRRHSPTRPWSHWLSPKRRASGRRQADHQAYVDRYTPRDVALVISIFLLNVGDAFFTMIWLSRAAEKPTR